MDKDICDAAIKQWLDRLVGLTFDDGDIGQSVSILDVKSKDKDEDSETFEVLIYLTCLRDDEEVRIKLCYEFIVQPVTETEDEAEVTHWDILEVEDLDSAY
jgi:hypothetical protein